MVLSFEMAEAEWLGGRNLDGETGYFPLEYVQLLDYNETVLSSNFLLGCLEAINQELRHPRSQIKPYENFEDILPYAAQTRAEMLMEEFRERVWYKAKFDCKAQDPDDLSFKKGDKIAILHNPKHEDFWQGQLNGKTVT